MLGRRGIMRYRKRFFLPGDLRIRRLLRNERDMSERYNTQTYPHTAHYGFLRPDALRE